MRTMLSLATLLVLSSATVFANTQAINEGHHKRISALHTSIDRLHLTPAERKEHDARKARLDAAEAKLKTNKLTPKEHADLEKEILKDEEAAKGHLALHNARKVLHTKNVAHHTRINAIHKGIDPLHLTPAERKEHAERKVRLDAHLAKLNAGGLTEKEHGDLEKEILKEEEGAKAHAAVHNARKVLHTKNLGHHTRISAIHAGIDPFHLTAAEKKEHEARKVRLDGHLAKLKAGGLTEKEHADLEKEILKEEDGAKAHAAVHVARKALHTKNLAHHTRISALHKSINLKKLTPAQKTQHEKGEAMLKAHEDALKAGGIDEKRHAEIEKELLQHEEFLKTLPKNA